jgi:hypothetical protein
MTLAQHNDVVEALSPDRSDYSFSVRILPGRLGCSPNIFDSERPHLPLKRFSENRVAISDEKSRLIVDCAALEQLACGPDSRRMLSNIHMQDSPTVMAQDDQHDQHPECRRWNREEIQRDRLLEMVLEKRLPLLRRWASALDHVLGDGRLANLDTELEQLAVNPRRTPEWICPAHPTNERPRMRPLVHGKLLPQCQILERKISA